MTQGLMASEKFAAASLARLLFLPVASEVAIFEEFVQTHHGHSQGGTGLGLAISRRLAHLLGGRLELTSTLGEGTTFTVWLPLAAQSDVG